MLVVITLLVGCVQVEGPPERRTRELPTQVEPGTPIQTVVLSAAPFVEDQDSNGFPDTINASVFLFPDQRASPLPVHAEGSIQFSLTHDTNTERVLAEWTFSHTELISRAARVDVGAVYVFQLNLNMVSTDRIPRQGASLTARFEGPGNQQPVSSSPITVVVGAGQR